MVSVWEDQTKFFQWLAGNFCLELTTLQASCCVLECKQAS